MRAMILAAGRGERLRPLTDTCPKPLIEVGGKPLIVWHIENLRRAGIEELVINTAWLDHVIHDALGDGSDLGVRIVYSDEGEALETAGGILKALPLLGDEPFLLISGDIWCDLDLSALASMTLDKEAHLVLVENPAHHPEGDFAIEEGYLKRLGQPTYTYSGIGVFAPSLLDGVTPGKHRLAPILRDKADAGEVTAEVFRGRWTDVGTVERLQVLQDSLFESSSRT